MKHKYFWVQYLDNWTIAELRDNKWWLPGYEESINKDHFDKVGCEAIFHDFFYYDNID